MRHALGRLKLFLCEYAKHLTCSSYSAFARTGAYSESVFRLTRRFGSRFDWTNLLLANALPECDFR